MRPMDNAAIAGALDHVAQLLEVQQGSPVRVATFRNAARVVAALGRPVSELLDAGAAEQISALGPSAAASVRELAKTGRLPLLARLEGEVSPEDQFRTVPGIGDTFARRIHEFLGIETLEELEQAAVDGRLEHLPGLGPRRAKQVQEVLAKRLGEASQHPPERPHVDALLAVDSEYRLQAKAGKLPRITPRRFNPTHQQWLPILHLERDGWSYAAVFSNSARAHRLGRTGDWVVLYFERDGFEDQCTVYTQTQGSLSGRRVVRGREAECAALIAAPGAAAEGERRQA